MILKFVGCGSAFTTTEYYQSNLLVIADNGKKLLIDCGSDVRFALGELGIHNGNVHEEIDGIYISHLHADHIGGLEWISMVTYFNPGAKKPKLYGIKQLLIDLWHKSLRGGLETLEGKVASLTDYFDCIPLKINSHFDWEGIRFTPAQTVHIMSGMKISPSYGLIIECNNRTVFLTTDTQFSPNQIANFYSRAEIIFHDCETSPFSSGVHAHYNDLKTLSPEIRNKMWLYHYQPNPPQKPTDDGFLGFVTKGQEFHF